MTGNSQIDIKIIKTEHELIDDAFEDLLIFPNKNTLQRCIQMIESHFSHEQTFLREKESISPLIRLQSKSQIQKQQQILDAMKVELHGKPIHCQDCTK